MTDPHDALRDDHLGLLVAEHGGLELDPADDPFERLVASIVRQPVSMDAAATIRERCFDAVDVTSSGVAGADPGTLRDVGPFEQKTGNGQNVGDWTDEAVPGPGLTYRNPIHKAA